MLAGRSLSEDSQKALLKAKIKAGCVLFLPCNFIDNPHPKFMLVTHVNYEDNFILVFLINSEIHPLIKKNPELETCQVTLTKSIYPFLHHNSFLNCTKVFDDLHIDEMLNYLLKNPRDYKGKLADDDVLETIQAVTNTPTLTDFDKDLIIASLGE